MANRTDSSAKSIHGTNPQFILSKIVRSKIYNSRYWKEKCFGLTATSILDCASEITHIGGTYQGNKKVTPFICLILKLLQIQPSKDIILEYIRNEHFKRLTGSPYEIYTTLEPLLSDYSKLRYLVDHDMVIIHTDEIIDKMLTEDVVMSVDLPVLPKRYIVEDSFGLPPYISLIEKLPEFQTLIDSIDQESNNKTSTLI